ncbi:hypothetical protein ACFQ51_44615 [Streptomyces kaempferi]
MTLPRLGTIRTHEPTVKLLARVEAGTARILSATVRHERGRWYVAFQARSSATSNVWRGRTWRSASTSA